MKDPAVEKDLFKKGHGWLIDLPVPLLFFYQILVQKGLQHMQEFRIITSLTRSLHRISIQIFPVDPLMIGPYF